MKLSGADLTRYFSRPDPSRPGILLFGQDAMRVALRRQEIVSALLGANGEAEMRLTRVSAGDLRKAPGQLSDAMKASGFFPGMRVVLVEDATDTCAPAAEIALKDWSPEDARLVMAAGNLTAKSALRKLFENHPRPISAGIYDDPPSREEVEDMLKRAGLSNVPQGAMADVMALARALDPGDLRQTIEKISLYKWNDPTPLTSEEIATCAPATIEADIDDLLAIVAESRVKELGPMMVRIAGQGQQPVALTIAAVRHFKALHAAAADPGGPGQGITKLRPPVYGPRRDRMLRQAQRWGMHRLEEALRHLIETDLTLRSSSKAPQMALVERAFLRISMMVRG